MIDSNFLCAFCARENFLMVDPSGGTHQTFSEECEFCDHLNHLDVTIDSETMEASIESRCDDHLAEEM